MAAGVLHLLRIPCIVCIVLYLCLEGGVNGDDQVPDGVVYTELQRTAEIGKPLVLTCRFYGMPIAVYWKKGVDPTTAPNLITWVEGESASGSCVNDRSCNITVDYSLYIRSVKVSDQGSYICRVSNHWGVLIHNFTEVTVFAAPSEPYPLIKECQPISNGPQSCRLPAFDSVTITCTASHYFPDIDLFFLHESITTNATYSHIGEETNVDGTKNKSISIVARPSENPYVCVASRIPRSQDRRTVSVTVYTIESTVAMTTTQTNQTIPPHQRHVAAKVVVPLILILLAVLVCIFIWWYKKTRASKHGKGDLESSPLRPMQDIKGKVSFYELWSLIHHMDTKYSEKLREVLIYLKICRAEDELTADNAYNLLCQWKDTNTYDDEATVLKNALVGHGLERLWKKLSDERYEATEVPDKTLNRILWNIGGEKQIRSFSRELLRDTQEPQLEWFRNDSDVIKDATNFLRQWCDKEHKENQIVQLSLALERAKFKSLDRQFFEDLEVPQYLQQNISPAEIQKCAHRLAKRHFRRLAVAAKIKDENQISTIIGENKDVLLIVEQMINDWLIGQECGNYEKRCKLDDAIIEIGRHDVTDSFGTTSYRVQSGNDHKREHSYANYFDCSSLFDDDIESLLRYLPSGAMPMFLEKIGILRGDDDVGVRLRCWRDQRIGKHKGCSLQETTAILIETLQETNNNYVLSLTDDDLENIVASMTSPKQMEVLASKLKIKPEGPPLQTLKNWMDGSKKDNRRDILWKALTSSELSGCIVQRLPSEYVYQPEMLHLAWSTFLTDVLPLANLLNMNINKRDSQLKGTAELFLQLLKKSHTLDSVRRRDFSIAIRNLGCLDIARSVYFGYDASLSELCNMVSGLLEDEIVKLMDNLELERDALSVCKGTTGEYDIVRLMEIWKGRHSSGPFDYRLKLALGLRAAGKTEVARKIIAGIGISDMVTVNPDVVKRICDGIGNGQLGRLAEHLGLNAKGDNQVDTSALVIQWATEWFSKADRSSLFESFKGTFTNEEKSRKKEIDNLFKAGFGRLAEELMLLEVSRLRIIKQGQMTLSDDFVDEPCESKNQETPEQMESENNLPSGACSEDSSTGVQGTSCNNENEDT